MLLVLNGAGAFPPAVGHPSGWSPRPLSAQTSFVTLGNAKAHPTQILAKYKDAGHSWKPERQRPAVRPVRGSSIATKCCRNSSCWTRTGPATGDDEAALRTRLIQRINDLKRTGLFEYVEPDYLVEANALPTDQAFVDGSLWGLRNTGQNGGVAGADIAATTAWDLTTGSTNVIVAVIDTGIRYTHRDLTNQMWRNPGESTRRGRTRRPTGRTTTPTDLLTTFTALTPSPVPVIRWTITTTARIAPGPSGRRPITGIPMWE
ncbi:MAG: hypothetical protein V9H26_09930 [Verrucomicrobiota bacterium]